MRKNIFAKAVAFMLCAFTLAPMAACGGGGGEERDDTKTQLNVFFYKAGFGEAWFTELKENFEESVKDISFEDGKMGVQIHEVGEATDWSAASVKRSNEYDVFFMENPSDFLNIMADGAVEPLDSIMTVENAADGGQTIESKMTQQQKDFYNYDGHYYGIPWYSGCYGIVYNKDLFDEYGFYIAAEEDTETGDILISATNPQKSVGPDGQPNTEDDGLPRTYDEFFALCGRINDKGVDPVTFPGRFVQQHISSQIAGLVANHEGAAQTNLNMTFNGTAENLVVIEGGKVKLENGVPVTESLAITESNGYELARQEGKYYAFQFIERLLSNTDYWNEDDGKGQTVTQLMCQQNYLEKSTSYASGRPSAMLLDGNWWQMEANDVFSYMSATNSDWSKDNRRFGWMPLPQATEEEAAKVAAGTKNSVYSSYMNCVTCVKAGLSEGVKNAAFALLQYAYTDKAMADFTYTTGTTIGMDYLDVVDTTKLNYYEKSLIDYIKKSDLVYHVSGSDLYARNAADFAPLYVYGGTEKVIYNAIVDSKKTGEQFFIGHQSYYKGLGW